MQKEIILVMFLFISTSIYSQSPCPNLTTVNYAGKTYNTVQIGKQCWLKENLDVGTMISLNQAQSNNSIIEKYCYDNKTENCDKYGGLYQCFEAEAYSYTPGTKGICPDGWHIPTREELETLINSNVVNINSNTLKAIGQGIGSGAGTNGSGFSALLAGYSMHDFFSDLGNYASFWSSTGHFTSIAYNMRLWGNASYIDIIMYDKARGYSVRCIKDVSTDISGIAELPITNSLSQNYPNPFNPQTIISYQLPNRSKVSLKVFDVLGKEVVDLVNQEMYAGTHEVKFDGSKLPSGIYFYTLRSGNYVDTKKLILIK